MAKQYVQVQLFGKSRAYLYHNDGDPLKVGDDVQVTMPHGHMGTGTVVEITDHSDDKPPNFQTKSCMKV